MKKKVKPRTAWAITGSGHYLKECLDLVQGYSNVDLFLSKAGAEVLSMYNFDLKSMRQHITCFRDSTASASPVGLFYHGHYDRLVIAPATSNTVAKMVWGVADTLVTNIYAQAGKCRIPSIVFACDTETAMETQAPDGMVMVYPRRIDLENVKRLREFEYTRVATSFSQLVNALEDDTECLSRSFS